MALQGAAAYTRLSAHASTQASMWSRDCSASGQDSFYRPGLTPNGGRYVARQHFSTACDSLPGPFRVRRFLLPAGGCVPDNALIPRRRLPRYNDSGLEQLRESIIQWNIADSLAKARAAGATPAQAAASALDLAQQTQTQLSRAEECIRQLSTDPGHTLTALQDGTFQFSGAPNALEACAKTYVSDYYMTVGTKEAAIVAACLASAKP